MVAIPGIAEDYDRWEDLGATGWGWDELSPWFARTALELNPADRSEWGPVNRRWSRRCRTRPGRCRSRARQPGVAWSTNDVYLEPARDRENLDVRGDALVDRVLLAGRRAVGVRLASGEEIEAGAVIVSAGAIHSPAILLRTSIDRGHRGQPPRPPGLPRADHARRRRGVGPRSLTIAVIARFGSGEDDADLQLLPIDHLGP